MWIDIVLKNIVFKKCSKILQTLWTNIQYKDRIKTELRRNKEIPFRNKEGLYFIAANQEKTKKTECLFEGII